MDWLTSPTCSPKWIYTITLAITFYYIAKTRWLERQVKRLKSSRPADAPAPARSGAPPAIR